MAKRDTKVIQIKLRFRDGLHRKVEAEARKNKRTLNGEIVERLEQSFARQETDDVAKAAAAAMFNEIIERRKRFPGLFDEFPVSWTNEKEKE